MNIANLEVVKGLIANKNPDTPQLIQVSISTLDIHSHAAELTWSNIPDNMQFATATLYYGDSKEWLSSWVSTTHLVQGRIEDLERLADAGLANRFTRDMAYLLFANNLVDYASKYRGMQSVVLNGLEAFADVTLSTEKGGVWTVPPFFIDSVAHLAGFIMNVSDSIDTKTNYCVTPGWQSMRFAKPLVAGAKYRSYVKMIPTADDPSTFLGDVYILQDNVIIGMVGGIQFHRYPRILLSRFFSAPDDSKAPPIATASSAKQIQAKPAVQQAAPAKQTAFTQATPTSTSTSTSTATPVDTPASSTKSADPPASAAAPKPAASDPQAADTTAVKAIQIIASEAQLEMEDLTDDANMAGLGIDSLMSLIIAEKFREQLGIVVSGSLFLEFPAVGDLRAWLEEYYN